MAAKISEFTGMPTLFLDLDRMIGGFSPSNLMILAARPAMGKTALALNIAENVCFRNGVPVGIFSLEMTAEQLCIVSSAHKPKWSLIKSKPAPYLALNISALSLL